MSPGEALRPVLRSAPFDGPESLVLIAELQQEYVQRYGGPDETPVDPREFDPPDGAFLVAELDGVLVGYSPSSNVGYYKHSTLARSFSRTLIPRDR
jgi:hypothetical protein